MAKLTFRELTLFWNGQLGQIAHIADLPPQIGAHIGAHTTQVWIELSYAHKLRRKHKLLREHFHIIQIAIDYGAYGLDRGDLLFHYDDGEIWSKDFKLVIKSSRQGAELWLKTFHKLDPLDVSAIRNRMQMIRDQY